MAEAQHDPDTEERSRVEKRRDAYRATHEAQKRAEGDPTFMAMLRRKLAELEKRVAGTDR